MDDSPQCLKALAPILIHGRVYKIGDLLPTDDTGDVAAWLETGSAVWVPVESLLEPAAPKAKLVVATPGLAGLVTGGEGAPDNLVGRVPLTAERRASCP